MREYLPTEREMGHDFDKESITMYGRIPHFETTKNIDIPSPSGIEYRLILPDRSHIDHNPNKYSERGKRGHRLTNKGKKLMEHNWQVLCIAGDQNPQLDLNGDNGEASQLTYDSIEQIKQSTKKVIEKLNEDNEVQSEYVALMKRSFEARIRHMEGVKFWQEMNASNSPFNQTIDVVSEKVYQGVHKNFVKSFSTKAFINLKEEVSNKVDSLVETGEIESEQKDLVRVAYENRLANHVEKYLENSSSSKLQSLRESGISNLVNNILDENRFTSSDKEDGDPLIGYMNKTLEGVLQDINEGKITTITAESIERFRTKVEPEPEPTVRERISLFGKKVKEHFVNMPAANKLRILTSGVMGTSLIAAASLVEYAKNQDINQELSAPNDPAKVWVSPEIDYALNLPEQPEEPDGKEVFRMATATATAEPTNTPTHEPTLEPTPTNTPEPLLFHGGIDFSKETEVKVQFTGLSENNDPISIVTIPKVYKDDFSAEETEEYFKNTAPSEGASQIDSDKYGNTILLPHSGYYQQAPLAAEALRKYLEGGQKSSPNSGRLSEEETQSRLEALIGTEVLIDQEGVNHSFEITAVGHVPNENLDDYYKDLKDVLDVVINNDGGKDSEFNIFRTSEGIIISFCGWGERSDPEWWAHTVYTIGLKPAGESSRESQEQQIKESVHLQNNSNTEGNSFSDTGSVSQEGSNSTLRSSAAMLQDAINSGVDSNLHGTELFSHIRRQIEVSGVEITQELSEGFRDFENELSDNHPPQCLETNNLYTSFPGIEAVDLYGWNVGNAKGLVEDEKERLMKGDVINTNNALRFRVSSASDYETGDHFVVPQTAVHSDGHIGTVIDRWEENGKAHLLIFDVNFRKDGKARIVEVTEENMYQVLAGLPEGMTIPLFAVRSYPDSN